MQASDFTMTRETCLRIRQLHHPRQRQLLRPRSLLHRLPGYVREDGHRLEGRELLLLRGHSATAKESATAFAISIRWRGVAQLHADYCECWLSVHKL